MVLKYPVSIGLIVDISYIIPIVYMNYNSKIHECHI